jgi:pyridoxamine 5'-phosphate oxidase
MLEPEPPRQPTADWLRALPSPTGSAPPLDMAALPSDPVVLFASWLSQAVDLGVAEPHAAPLATVDADGFPDARTLIVKGVDDRGWAFAGPRSSMKAAQLAARPAAALDFWWQPLVRAVRVRGRVVEASPQESAADLAARSAAARNGLVPGDWMLWRLVPSRMEFWQGETDRRHSRIVYEVADGRWTRAISGKAADRTEEGAQS